MDAVEDIKSRLAIEDVIGEYVELKRAGRNFKGLSPFTAEKTPSFMVSPEKQIWHDFSSSKGGNMFSFVMEMEGLDFKGALELLARKAGIDLDQYRQSGHGSNNQLKERLFDALEQAATFYQVQFSRKADALNYILKKRNYSKQTALAFRIGYSPNNGSALLDYLRKKGFKDDEIKRAGLATQRYAGLNDMFRGRIMLPLQDPQGRVIGFTARLLQDDPKAPKYINTPQTLLYDKGRHIYGLHLAKEAIRRGGYAVLVEGNLDVVAAHQAGTNQVVATAGTALTEMHLKGISRFAGDVRLAFDQDKAGQAATERAIPIASKTGVSLSMIHLPSGKDPDDLIQQAPDTWRSAIEEPQYALDWLMDRYKSHLDLDSAVGKRKFSDVLLDVVRQLKDPVEQDHYIQKIAADIGVTAEALRSKLQQTTAGPARLKQPKFDVRQAAAADVELIKFQDHLLAILLFQPALRRYLKELDDKLFEGRPECRSLLDFLRQNEDFSGDPKTAAPLQEIGDYVKILGLQFETLYQDIELLELRNEVSRLQGRVIDHYVKHEKQRLAQQIRQASESEATKLLEQVKSLDQLLKAR